jgi:hypothetical protein
MAEASHSNMSTAARLRCASGTAVTALRAVLPAATLCASADGPRIDRAQGADRTAGRQIACPMLLLAATHDDLDIQCRLRLAGRANTRTETRVALSNQVRVARIARVSLLAKPAPPCSQTRCSDGTGAVYSTSESAPRVGGGRWVDLI